jgi:hypothetical protein
MDSSASARLYPAGDTRCGIYGEAAARAPQPDLLSSSRYYEDFLQATAATAPLTELSRLRIHMKSSPPLVSMNKSQL